MEKKFYLESYGCAANRADGEKMINLLINDDWSQVDENDANLLIINTCGVKNLTEKKIIKRLLLLFENDNTPIIISGCLPRIIEEKLIDTVPNYGALIDTRSIHKITEAANNILNNKRNLKYYNSMTEASKKSSIFNIDKNRIIGIIPISEGCLGSCSYCATRFARGKLVSFPTSNLVNHARYLINIGKKEIWITSQDNGSYQYQTFDLVDLLEKILEIPKFFKIRIGMTNPDTLIPIWERLTSLMLKDSRIYNFLHIPLQSGNNNILKIMNRKYTVEDYKDLIINIRKKIPNIAFSTDIICGFSEETEDEFDDTLNFLKWMKPNVTNVSRFSLRSKTTANALSHVHGRISKERSTKAIKLIKQITFNKKSNQQNNTVKILINEQGKNSTMIGRAQNYDPVVVTEGTLGEEILVKIVKITTHYLVGEKIDSQKYIS